MKDWDVFLEEALKCGFSVALKWTNDEDGMTAVTYTLTSPSGKPFGRGVLIKDKMDWSGALNLLSDSGLKSIEKIKREFPDAMIKSENKESIFTEIA